MIVSCEHCAARYKLDPARVTGRGVRITCPRCKHVFVVYNQDAQDEQEEVIETEAAPSTPSASKPAPSASKAAAPAPARAPEPPPPPARKPRGDVGSLDFASVGIQAWKVKVAIGLVYDFSDYKTLARYIKDGRVSDGDQISHDGKSWTVLGQIADLEEHFFLVYEEAERRMAQGKAPAERSGFEDESPTMIVGAASVASSIGNVAGLGASSAPRSPVESDDDSSGLSAAMSAALDAEDEGPAEHKGPRFHDPFAKSRAERAANNGARRKPSAEPARSSASRAPASEPKNKRGLVTVVVVGILLGGLGGGAWLALSAQQAEADLAAAEAEAARQAQLQAQQQEIQAKAGKALEASIKKEIEAAIEIVPDDGFQAEDEEDLLIPVGPSGTARATSGAGTTVDLGNGTTGTVSTSASTPADHFAAGRTAYNTGNYAAAVGAFNKATAGDPGNGQYYKWLGLAQMKTGDGGAQVSLSKAASLGDDDAYVKLGDLLASQGDTAGAMDAYQQYLSRHPGDAGVQSKIDSLTR